MNIKIHFSDRAKFTARVITWATERVSIRVGFWEGYCQGYKEG